MPRPSNFRHRSSSGGSYSEVTTASNGIYSDSSAVPLPALKTTCKVMNMVLNMKDMSGKSFLHSIDSSNIAVAKALLDRAQQVDIVWKKTRKINLSEDKQQQYFDRIRWLQVFMLQPDEENGYTPLHWAVWNKNIVSILLLLRHALNTGNLHSISRLTHRPAQVLEGDTTANELAQKMVQAVDNEGLTPLQLLQNMQRGDLDGCRKSLPQPAVVPPRPPPNENMRSRRPSFDDTHGDEEDEEQDEFLELRRGMRILANRNTSSRNNPNANNNNSPPSDTFDLPKYACEVLTFGPAHHCALGVPQGGGGGGVQHKSSATTQFRPQRVQAFGLDTIGRAGAAVAIAASTHHTLVVTRNGDLYAFGLGIGGRLGTGDERHRPLPTQVLGVLSKRLVVAVAAAENHSLCVTSDGNVFAWGSDRFGQLGVTSNDGNESMTRCTPRRVDELKQVHCVAVAAGEKHSVALSRRGEVYVWGDNSAGQLGVSRRNGSQRVQRVEALWNTSPTKPAIAIAASGLSTLVLTAPAVNAGPSVNSVYSWGHGNHTPSKIQFGIARGGNQRSYHVNPIALACAKYHYVVATADGRVYTWGLHREPLGTGNVKKSATQSMVIASPQLVTGMLPENGGGLVVAVSASENHTAVLTDCGSLYTWGASHGKDVLGHEGVRWQPIPKRVPGVHRAVAVASAKEHTVLLIGASFPEIPLPSSAASLEYRCAAVVAQHVDLFNVIPVLIMSERSQNSFLIEYCQEFVRRNLDGVLNLGRKSEMNSYLDEQLSDGLHSLLHPERDDRHHPFIYDVVTAGNSNRPSFRAEITCGAADWAMACHMLEKRLPTSCQLKLRVHNSLPDRLRRSRAASFQTDEKSTKGPIEATKVLETGFHGCSDRCLMLTASMDLSSREAVKAKYDCLTKEVRGIRKRLNQITKLVDTELSSEHKELTVEQQEKVSRRPLLQADLAILERALDRVKQRMREYNLLCNPLEPEKAEPELKVDEMPKSEHEDDQVKIASPHRCSTCQVDCPDQNSYTFHLSGRKHRNRILQAAEEEKKEKAVEIMEESQKGPFKGENHDFVAEFRRHDKGTSSTIAPIYKLPPPPHPVVDVVEIPNPDAAPKNGKWTSPSVSAKAIEKPKGFREILEEEEHRKASSASAAKAGRSPLKPTTEKQPSGHAAAKLPLGYGTSPKSPPPKSTPWAAASSPTPMKLSVGLTGAASSATSPPWAAAGNHAPVTPTAVLKLPAGAAPPLKSPPWATSSVHVLNAVRTTAITREDKDSKNLADSGKRGGISLGDFMTKSPGTTIPETPRVEPTATQAKAVSAAKWAAPKASVTSFETPKQMLKSLLEIQREEEAYNRRQGKSSIINKWYVERREKTGSLVEIQEEDSKAREFRLLVEEQRQIEEQIQRDREQQEVKGRQPNRNKKSPKTKTKTRGKSKQMRNASKPTQLDSGLNSANGSEKAASIILQIEESERS